MLKIGITGGIGSGKSIVCKAFKALGIPVYTADDRAKMLIQSHPELKQRMIDTFGRESYTSQGYNTRYMASIVFNHPEQLKKINALVHPFVKADFNSWIAKQISPYIIYEAAILFETGGANEMDQVILVDAPQELRIQRVIQRDNTTPKQVLERIANQWPTDKKRAMADWIIENNDKQLLLPQILNINNELTEA